MSTAGSREEMLKALQKAKQAMLRRVPVEPPKETSAGVAVLQLHDTEPSLSTSLSHRPRPQVRSEAKENRSHFFDTWCRKIEMFVADSTKTVLELPKELGANDRRELHTLAEMYNLSHHSRGSGATRQLMLKKDALHYRMPDARPDNIDTIRQNAGNKQSKFHLRRIQTDLNAAPGSIGAFSDEATANMVRRLDRATDEYRKAVEVGYSHEELLALEAGETVEEVLRRTENMGVMNANSFTYLDGAAAVSSSVLVEDMSGTANKNIAAGKRKMLYDEVCLRCGTRARVDYEVTKWECNGYCAQCATQTVWKLVEVATPGEELVYASADVDRKRGRRESEPETQLPEPQPEEIDKDNDEDDTITVEDLVDMASMNDFCAADINWIRRFARHHSPQGSKNVLSEHIVFCIQFEDLFSMRIFRGFLSPKESTDCVDERKRLRCEGNTNSQKDTDDIAWFVRLCEVKEANVPLSTLLEELSTCIPEGYNRLAVAFPNMSVYGIEATCVCLIRPSALQESSLEELQRRYGRRGVRFAQQLSRVLTEVATCFFLRRGCAVHSADFTVVAPEDKVTYQEALDENEQTQIPKWSNMIFSVADDVFINPFTGRLTSVRSRTARELLRVGFQRSAVNPFRLTWDAAKWKSASAVAFRPFQNSMITWRKNLAALLTREDAADAVFEEVHRLYGNITSAYLPPKLDTMHDPQLSTMTMTTDQENAIRFAMRGYSMFVGGSAGTGKTVLLKAMHRRLTEMGLRVAMTATTGVASVQLGGCTFHLAFGVPIGSGDNFKKRWDANALRAVDVVIIDEVSLLDAELFDAFETEARMARLQPLPFGGLQVIACGDFLQLASSDIVASGPCYQSAAFGRLIAVSLVTPMRQAQGDPLYKILANLRAGKFDEKAFALLDRSLPEDTDNVTYIFPRRREAQRLNDEKLCELQSEEMMFIPQRGPLHLIGSFTSAGVIRFFKKKALWDREEIVQVLMEETKRVAAVDVVNHNVVIMPVQSKKNSVLIRLRIPDDTVSTRKDGNGTSNTSRQSGVCSNALVLTSRWKEILEATAIRLNATLQHIYEEDPQGFVPLSVSMTLADSLNHPNAEYLTPLRLKLGCRVMINRNLSRTVSNGSVGVVEAFAVPNPDLFPRRHETSTRTLYGRLLEKNMFPKLPIVRLLDGEVVQVPPLSLMVGGTPSTFFYGHELYSLPLQLGYAFTVHKVQGLTLHGSVVLDCKNFFECPHLIYVACSRVRSLDQLIVKNIRSDMVIVKRGALEFSTGLKDASDITAFVPPEGCARASWVARLGPRLMGLSE